MKRALKKRVKAVLTNNPSSDDAPVEYLSVINPKVNRRARTQAAMIGLAISMGATSLLVTRQSDQAQAAAPVGSQKAASTISAASEPEVKIATTKLESQAVPSASVPENPVIVEPTAVSQVPGLEAKWQIAANGMAVQVPASEAITRSTVGDKNFVYLQPQVAQGLSNTTDPGAVQTTNQPSEKLAQFSSPEVVAGNKTPSLTVETANPASGEVNAQLKAQQEFALNRLQEKSNRLRKSLAQLQSGETKNLSQPAIGLAQPKTVAESKSSVIPQPEIVPDASKSNLLSRLKQNEETSAVIPQLPTAVSATPKVTAPSATTAYEVKPGDTLAAIAKNYGTSVSELVKANNLDNPNQLQISQKLMIPVAVLNNSNLVKEPTVAIKPTVVPSTGNWTVATSSVNGASAIANQPIASQLPVIANKNNVTVPTQVTANNQTQANTATVIGSGGAQPIASETTPTPDNAYGVGGDTPVPKAFTEYQLAGKPTQKVAQGNSNERLRSLQAEIERLRQKYRAQQSGIATPEVTEIDTVASDSNSVTIPVPVVGSRNFRESRPFTQRNAVQIPVPQPILPSYSAQPTKPLFRASQPTNEPINPEFLPNQAASQWTPYRNPSGARLATPPRNLNASDSLGKMRGTTVSPQLPPLAAVDQYLPRAIEPGATPNSSSFSTSYIWPAKGVLTSGYGWRWGRMHKGIDIANSTGTPVYAASDGVVEKAGWNNGGYGNLVDIRHPDGSLTRYGHNSRILVQVGQQVQQGQTIAAMGSTGFSTGPHTHFEVHPAGKKAVNPIAFLPARL